MQNDEWKDNLEQEEKEPNFIMQDSEPEVKPEPEVKSEPKPEPEKVYDSYRISTPVPESHKEKTPPLKPKASVGRKFAMCVSLAVVFGLVAGLCFQAVNLVGNKVKGNQKQETTIGTTTLPNGETDKIVLPTEGTDKGVVTTNTVASVSKGSMPSVVAITNVSVQEVPDYFGLGKQSYEGKSTGSGIIVGQNDTELLIATNNHVVAGATSLSVCFAGQEVKAEAQRAEVATGNAQTTAGDTSTENAVEAQTKGTDETNDLAVIAVKLENIPEDVKEQIKVAKLGDSSALQVGEQVVAIGNALGYGQSVTSGYISALNRKVTVENVTSTLIQTDAAINPGNSGGALLNMQGELIGINAAKFAASGVEGMGYAIPISTAEPILNELMNRETRYKVEDGKTSYLGITAKNIDAATAAEIAKMYNMPAGIIVAEVMEKGPAEKAGIKKGDIITKLDKTAVTTYAELTKQLEYYAADEAVDVVVARAENGEYKEQTISVTLGNRKDMPVNNTQITP